MSQLRSRKHYKRGQAQRDIVFDMPSPLSLHFFPHHIILERRDSQGLYLRYPVDPSDVVRSLQHMPVVTDILPPNTLLTGRKYGQPLTISYLPTQLITVTYGISGNNRSWRFQIPPLIWYGNGIDYRLFALNTPEYPSDLSMPLCHAPFPNVYHDGRICWGTSEQRPTAEPRNMMSVWRIFQESGFVNHLVGGKSKQYPSDIIKRWERLTEAKPYPLNDLVPSSLTLKGLL